MKRATLVVEGTYDFSKPVKRSRSIWVGYNFKVDRVFKGEAYKTMTVGIDGFDDSWANDVQLNGGKFLLFLEQGTEAAFVTPIAGPNGMIQLYNGKVKHDNAQSKHDFDEYLRIAKSSAPLQGELDVEESGGWMRLATGAAVLIAMVAAALLVALRIRRRRA